MVFKISRDQARAQRLDRKRGAGLEFEAAGLDVGDRWQPRKQAFRRQQQCAARQRRQLRERTQALRDDVRMRGKNVIGEYLPIRQRQDGEVRPAEEAQLVAEAFQVANPPKPETIYTTKFLPPQADRMP